MIRSTWLLAAAASACLLACPGAAYAATTAYQHGPAPTAAALQARGPYATTQISVPDSATPGFGSATITYPTTTADGTFGAVAVSPGFTGPEASIRWYGPAVASYGFVVITFNTSTLYDQPASRGKQLLAALDYLTTASPAADRTDPTRTAVVGHSMGGGGALEAAKSRHALKAAVGLMPWDLSYSAAADTTPTLIVGAQNDNTAAPAFFANPLYKGIPATTPKAEATIAGAGHLVAITPNAAIQSTVVAWLKRFVDDDTRYTSVLCPTDTVAPVGSLSGYVSNCSSWK